MNVSINWSQPIEIFKPGTYNTDEKFIEHLRKFIEEQENPVLDKKGIFMFLSGELKPQEKLSVVIVEGAADHTIREKIVKKKGHIREFKCLYKNYKNENLYLKIGTLEDVEINSEIIQNIVCALIDYASPSCNEPCKNKAQISIYNRGDYSPLSERYGKEEE
jgi:hypothetical protein